MKKIFGLYSSPRPHWVGDGFPVRSIFSHGTHGDHVSPFLLLDYAGPARTFTPIDIWDVRLKQGKSTALTFPAGHSAGLVVLRGNVRVNGAQTAREAQFVLHDREAGNVSLEARDDAMILVLSGEPIDEAVVMHGPFVMNTPEEIRAAVADFQAGRFGVIAASEAR